MGSELEPAIFRFPDLPKREAGALLIQPPQLVTAKVGTSGNTRAVEREVPLVLRSYQGGVVGQLFHN